MPTLPSPNLRSRAVVAIIVLSAVGVVLCGWGLGLALSSRGGGQVRPPTPAPPPVPPPVEQTLPPVPPATKPHAGSTPPVPAVPSKAASKSKVICIDPGHPSETSDGTSAPGGPTEMHVNWVVAEKLQANLEKAGYTVVMTKHSEKEHVTNRRRAEIANEAGAALLVRLHCDDGPPGGYAIYYPNQSGTSQGVKGPSEDIQTRSKAAARTFHGAFAKAIGDSLPDRGIHGDTETAVGGKQGALTGSIFAKVPVLTVEMICMDRPHDVEFVRSEAGITKLATALAAGVGATVGQ